MRSSFCVIFVLSLLVGIAHPGLGQQAWRPFRPGLIYSFTTARSSNLVGTYLLRLDSAYAAAGGDSVWAFNRLLRPLGGDVAMFFPTLASRKSRNNLFGARLRWTPSADEFMLENVAEGNFQAAFSLRLRPRAAVGSTWAASTAPALTATLTSRTWQPVTAAVGSLSDSVAVITLSSGQVLRLSRRYGLLAGPRWLATSGPAPQWEVAELPATLANSPVYPATLFNLQPGDRLGYAAMFGSLGGLPCTGEFTLRVVQSRRLVGDSLLYTYRQQTRTVYYGSFMCAGGPPTVGPVRTGRLTFSLRTGQSPQFRALPMLSGEYWEYGSGPRRGILVLGLGLAGSLPASCQGGGATLNYQEIYPFGVGNGTQYSSVTDGNPYQSFAPQTGLGDIQTDETYLTYSVRLTAGVPVTCGSPADFVNLLPTRAAQAAAIASLAPNPAADQAILTLTAPARPGTRLVLRDALGRTVWSAPVPAGQTEAGVPLVGQPAGLYLLQVERPEAAPVTLRLTKE